MQPNKKPRGFFMHPGLTGFKFKAGSLKSRFGNNLMPRIATAFVLGVCMFLAIASFSPFAAALFFVLSMAMPFTKLPMGILGEGAGGAGEETDEEKLMKKFKAESKTAIDEALTKFKKEDVEYIALKALKEKVDGLKPNDEEASKKMREDLDELGLKVKALGEAASNVKKFKKGSIAETLMNNKAKLDEFISKKSGKLMIEHKASETSTDIDGRENFFTWHEGGRVGQLPVRRPFMRELFRNVSTTTEFIKYMDQETIVRDAKNVALCGVTTSNTKVTFKVRSIQIQKVRDFIDICLDMMNDYAFVQGEIENLLATSKELKIDNDLLLGTGVAPILNSVDMVASTFDAAAAGADYSESVTAPNLIDLISIAGAQIKAFGQQNMWMPNYVLLNPREVQNMKALKDKNDNYIKNPMLFSSLFQDSAGRYYIDGMLLVENPLVPENEFYIGDFTKGTIYSMPGIGIEFAYENNDNFEVEVVTVKIYERLNLLIRNLDANAFMHCDDIEAALVAITKPSGL